MPTLATMIKRSELKEKDKSALIAAYQSRIKTEKATVKKSHLKVRKILRRCEYDNKVDGIEALCSISQHGDEIIETTAKVAELQYSLKKLRLYLSRLKKGQE